MKRFISKSMWMVIVAVAALMVTSCPPPITPDMVTFAEDETPPTIEIANPLNYSYYYTTLSVIGVLVDYAHEVGDERGRLREFSFSIPGILEHDYDFTVVFDYDTETYIVTPGKAGTAINFVYDFASGDFSFSFDDLDALNASHELIFAAVDWRNNLIEKTIVIQDDNQGPSIDVTNLAPSLDGQTLYYSNAVPRTITVDGQFGTTLTSSEYEITEVGPPETSVAVGPTNTNPDFSFSFSFDTNSPQLSGYNRLNIIARGNGLESNYIIPIYEDSVAPSLLKHLSLTSNNAVDDEYGTLGNVVTLRFDADDILDPDAISITIQGNPVPAGNISFVGTYSDGGTFYEWRATHTLISQTNNTMVPFTITRYDDKAGNTGPVLDESDITHGAGVTYDDSVPNLSAISVSSDNGVNADKATTGDTVSVQFWHSSPLNETTNPPVVTILGRSATGLVMNVPDGPNYRSTAQVQVQGTDSESAVTFQISNLYNNLGVQSVPVSYNAVTDGSLVTIDRTPPAAMASPAVTVTGSGVVPGYWNSTSTGFTLNVAIPNDITLLHGTGANGYIQFQASQDGGSYGNIGSTKAITVIGVGDVFSLSAADLNTYDSSISEGTDITIRAVLYDTAGNTSTGSASAGITYDETPPSVNITGPAASTRTDGSALLTYTTDGIDNADVRLNGGTWYAFSSGLSLFSITSFGALGQGSFTVEVRDWDAAGNIDISSSRTLIKDTVAPTVAVSYDASGDTDGYYNDSQTLTIIAVFNENMARPAPAPLITINAPASGGITNQTMTWTSDTRATYTGFSVGSGTETATVTITTAEDSAGNAISGAPTSGGTFSIDNTAPTVAISYSDPDLYFNGSQNITITATFSEPMANSPRPFISSSDGPDSISGQMTWSTTTEAWYSYSVGNGDGTGTITISAAEDLADNEVTNSPTSGGTFYVDNTDPSVSIDAPPDSTDVIGTDLATFTFGDDTDWGDSILEVRIVGVGVWQTLTNTHPVQPTLRFDTLLSWGTLSDSDDFQLRVRHTDAAENTATNTRDFTKIVP